MPRHGSMSYTIIKRAEETYRRLEKEIARKQVKVIKLKGRK